MTILEIRDEIAAAFARFGYASILFSRLDKLALGWRDMERMALEEGWHPQRGTMGVAFYQSRQHALTAKAASVVAVPKKKGR